MRRIKIFDTTLRDGEQAPGFSLTVAEKLQVARQLKKLGVDVIEAGFPIASSGDFEAVSLIAKEAQASDWPIICGLARCRQKDIDACFEALRHAHRQRIHIFIATSSIHLERKLKMTPDQALAAAVESVSYAKSLCADIEFSAEDATRSNRDFLVKTIQAVIDAGATTINIPDTVGYAHPEEFGDLISLLYQVVPNINLATISVHCHNDLGLAVANSLAAIRNGAGQVEVCVNGIGERAGNAALEELVMNLQTRRDFYNAETGIDISQIGATSRLLSRLTGVKVQPNKPIVGANAFQHEAGVHQHGIIKGGRETYEIINPRDIGWEGESLKIGKHSGLHGFRKKLAELGFSPDDEQLKLIYQRVMKLADDKKDIYEEDLMTEAEQVLDKNGGQIRLLRVQVSTGTDIEPTAIVKLDINGSMTEAFAHGNGPVDAAFKAVQKLLADSVSGVELERYQLKSLTGGTDALASAFVQLRKGHLTVRGRYAHTDVVLASLGAYIQSYNRLLKKINQKNP